MTTLTLNYRFTLPNYDITGWDVAINNNLIAIDSLLAQFNTGINLAGVWTNSTNYSAGQSVIDGQTGFIWACGVSNTSIASPGLFATDRSNNSTWWTNITNPAITAAASASAAAASASAALAAASHNRLINGAFDVNQRGSSSYTSASYNITADRWFSLPVGVTPTVSFGSSISYGSRIAASITATLAAGNAVIFGQRLEAANCYDLVGQQVTASFYCAYTSSAGVVSFNANVGYATATDNFNSVTNIQTVAFIPTSVPGLYTATFAALPSNIVNGLQFSISATQSGATGNLALSLGTLSLQQGTANTGFERRSVGQELALCQRYYQTHSIVQLGGYAAATGSLTTTTLLIPPMRAVPTIAQVSPTYGNATAATLTAFDSSSIASSVAAIAAGNFFASFGLTLSAEL